MVRRMHRRRNSAALPHWSASLAALGVGLVLMGSFEPFKPVMMRIASQVSWEFVQAHGRALAILQAALPEVKEGNIVNVRKLSAYEAEAILRLIVIHCLLVNPGVQAFIGVPDHVLGTIEQRSDGRLSSLDPARVERAQRIGQER